MTMRSMTAILLAALISLAAPALPLAQTPATYGAATPQEVAATARRASAANDVTMALPILAPAVLKDVARDGVIGILMALAFSDPDDPMPGSKPTAAELQTKRRDYRQAVDLTKQMLKPYGLDTLIGKPVLADASTNALDAAVDKADNVVLITALLTSLEKIGPLLGMPKNARPPLPVTLNNPSGFQVAGDTATAKDGNDTVNFVRVGGRWYLTQPKAAAAAAAATGNAAPQAPAPRATAAGRVPEVVAGGLQIASVAMPKDDYSARPFNGENGTKLLLWIKMPANQGLIEIDDDASVLEHFGDDKGTNLGGGFESFPDEFKDASGGIIEVESSAVPAAGSSVLTAQGTLALSVATGTRKTRAANVALRNDATFRLGSTTITISEVEADGENQSFTLKLPRQTMMTIKEIKFFDGRNQALEGQRTSSGYMNDAAELGMRVTTQARTITLEFETWQGLRTLKVPFNVQAGMGLR
jgi:hypothetical protein